MILIGMLDSPYVRRVAICMKVLGITFEHQPLSVFRDFEDMRAINPVVKVPTLITDDNQQLMDSTLILDYLQTLPAAQGSLMAPSGAARLYDLTLTGLALAACEKAVQMVYEWQLRPVEKQHQPWLDRVQLQLLSALTIIEEKLAHQPPQINSIAGVSIAVAWSFIQLMLPAVVKTQHFPLIATFSDQAEQTAPFIALPMV
ncbi:glutathione S-transferase [Pantoea sp. B65]|uniref:glutathione S-transferase n=1 Tax=Pantoea sp. B65 TaxID=2813359 RepID=UPI0039B558EC